MNIRPQFGGITERVVYGLGGKLMVQASNGGERIFQYPLGPILHPNDLIDFYKREERTAKDPQPEDSLTKAEPKELS